MNVGKKLKENEFAASNSLQKPTSPKKRWLIWILIIVVVAAVIFVALNLFKVRVEKNSTRTSEEKTEDGALEDGKYLSGGKCQGDDKPKISHLPMNESDFSMILPYGMVVGNHVTPIDHQYFSPTDYKSKVDAYPVYAMADARLVGIEKRSNSPDIRLVFSMSCKLFYYYDLVTSLVPEIEKETGGKPYASTNIEVKAGQQIGWIGGRTLDFAVWDMDVWLPGFVDPKKYEGERWKIHTADPLLYYTDEFKAKVLAKYIRTAEPVSGKIDYDIDGKLIGNWFLEGTNGYSGGSVEKYWEGHLSIAPDFIDPTSFVISIGNYQGEPKQFGVKGNLPDPRKVGLETGLVKYELVQQEWVDGAGKIWNRMSFAKGLKAKNHDDRVEGTLLVQLLENRKLRLEVFQGKKVTQVSGFTENARIYVR